MKTMKKLVAALLVLTMVLALTGSAFAACLKVDGYAKFTKNSYAYKETSHGMKKVTGPEVIIRKKSIARVQAIKGSYAFLQLTRAYPDDSRLGNAYIEEEDGTKYWFWGYWFKTSTLKPSGPAGRIVGGIDVTFSNGGNGKSLPIANDGKIVTIKDSGTMELKDLKAVVKELEEEYGKYLATLAFQEWIIEEGKEVRLSPDCMKHVEAVSKTWMHKAPGLNQSYGKALRSGDKVKYRRIWGFDTRWEPFLGIKYKGKCLWVSSRYVKFVK